MSNVISTYLQDHHAGSAAGVEVFRRVAQGHGDPEVREQVHRMVPEITRDQTSLEDLMSAIGVKPALYKDLSAKAGERIGRLKANERIMQRSPLSDVEELEGLVAAMHAKALSWRLLLEVPDERLDKDLLQDLLKRAQEQEATLETLRLSQARKLMES